MIPLPDLLRIMENRVIQIRDFRECGGDTPWLRKQHVIDLCATFEAALVHEINAWIPGTPIDGTNDLADFILRVRDVHGVFGERDVAYALLWSWHRYFPEWALRMFRRFVGGVGCWSDVKYMCAYLRDDCSDTERAESFRDDILDVMLAQLRQDLVVWEQTMDAYFENRRQFFGIGEKYEGERENGNWKRPRDPLMKRPYARKYISLAAKWCPRENSKFGWVFALLVERYAGFPSDPKGYRCDPKGYRNDPKGYRIDPKAKARLFRQTVSRLSREILHEP